MKNRIKAIIEDKIGVQWDMVDGEHLYDDLAFDSLDLIEILMYMEQEYDISINDDEAAGWQTIDDIVKTVNECLGAKK